METERSLVSRQDGALDRAPVARLVGAFLSGRSARTLDAYRADLGDFAAFVGVEGVDEAAGALLACGLGAANERVLAYRAHLLERGLSPATINRRLSAVRSLVKLARTLGLVPWTLQVPSIKSRAYRDTAGPGRAGFVAMLGVLNGRTDAKACRDRALLRLLYDLALRRGEVVALDVADVDLAGGMLAVLGKGRTEKETRTLPEETKHALAAWLEARGSEPGPLFFSFDRRGRGRLTGEAVRLLVAGFGRKAGLTGRVRPHGLRHAAITDALDRTGGNLRAVACFSRHADLRTLRVYDDNRADLAGEVARLVAAGAPE